MEPINLITQKPIRAICWKILLKVAEVGSRMSEVRELKVSDFQCPISDLCLSKGEEMNYKISYLVFIEKKDGEKLTEEFEADPGFWVHDEEAKKVVKEKYGEAGYKGISKVRLFREINPRIESGSDH